VRGYFSGFTQASNFVPIVEGAGQKELFCASAGATNDRIIKSFLEEVKKHPQANNESVPGQVFLIMSRRFPCPVDVTSLDKPSTSSKKPPTRGAAESKPPRDYFTVGSTKDEVLRIQGQPTTVSELMWFYGISHVDFDINGRVVGWDGSNIKAKMVPGGTAKIGAVFLYPRKASDLAIFHSFSASEKVKVPDAAKFAIHRAKHSRSFICAENSPPINAPPF
jgi:hypothetical protein